MIKKINSIIPCAGSQIRMETKMPKSLLKINGEPSLNRLIKLLYNRINLFYLVISEKKNEKNLFLSKIEKKFHRKIRFITSLSGSGDGQAVLDAIIKGKISHNINYTLLCWGDVYFKSAKTVNFLFNYVEKNNIKNNFIVPLYERKNPYVAFIKDNNNIIHKVFFQRRKQYVDYGFQDLGFFLIKTNIIKKYLLKLKKINKTKKELNFLDLVKILYKNQLPIESITLNFSPDVYSFNILSELKRVRNNAK